MYCRKSTDSEDRQIQSIEDQEQELNKLVSRFELNVVKKFCESKTAKQPGRPMFNEAMKMIEGGEADGILCWKMNRLSRNPIDGGYIQWLLQQGIIKSIMTPGKEYLTSDNVIMMSVELGMANQFIIDLSKDVKRGMSAKVEKGWRPGKAPLGYLNDKYGDKGNKQIFKDETRFQLVRKMWDFLLTGSYTLPRIVDIATNEWGLRTRDNDKLALSTAYKIFTNPFYYGEFYYNGELKKGSHEAMISVEEYDKAQKILGTKGKPRAKNKRLAFTGIIECSECGGMIVCEEKFKNVKSTGEIGRYVYYRCSGRKKDKECHQGRIKYDELKDQIEEYLDQITIPEEFLNLAIGILRNHNEMEESNRNSIIKNHRDNYENCLKRIDNLINLYISIDNKNKDLLTEQEYKEQKNSLMKEKSDIEHEIRNVEERVNDWLELSEKTFNFATYAKQWFDKGDVEEKTYILRALGENWIMKDGKLSIELQKQYAVLRDGLKNEDLQKAMFEPMLFGLNQTKNSPLETVLCRWSG